MLTLLSLPASYPEQSLGDYYGMIENILGCFTWLTQTDKDTAGIVEDGAVGVIVGVLKRISKEEGWKVNETKLNIVLYACWTLFNQSTHGKGVFEEGEKNQYKMIFDEYGVIDILLNLFNSSSSSSSSQSPGSTEVTGEGGVKMFCSFTISNLFFPSPPPPPYDLVIPLLNDQKKSEEKINFRFTPTSWKDLLN
jgi:hypothetical protein